MKLRLQGMLAITAAAAALLASAHVARADGMPTAPATYERPALWSGAYIGIESGWNWDNTEFHGLGSSNTGVGRAHWDRDSINAGLYAGYQHQFGPIVAGVEFSIIGNQFDNGGDVTPTRAFGGGNCPNLIDNCVGRITDVITLGPRLGYAVGNFMPYVTGGWATGSINTRVVPPTVGVATATSGVAIEWGDRRLDGYYIGGGLDWKLASHVVVGIEYRHTDFGSGNITTFNPSLNGNTTNPVETIRARADSDAILLRASLLFGREDFAPLK
jgi:outer membrane immunogenic protein